MLITQRQKRVMVPTFVRILYMFLPWASAEKNAGGGKQFWGTVRGSEATERGEGVGGGIPPSHGRDFLKIRIGNMCFLSMVNTYFKGRI